MSELPATAPERRVLLDEMSEIHETLDEDGVTLFNDLASQVAIDDEAQVVADMEEIQSTREAEG